MRMTTVPGPISEETLREIENLARAGYPASLVSLVFLCSLIARLRYLEAENTHLADRISRLTTLAMRAVLEGGNAGQLEEELCKP